MSLASVPRVTEDPEWKADGKIVFFRDLPPGDHHTSEQKQYDLPYSFCEDALKHRTRTALQTCDKPKLFITGKYDTQNETSQTPEIYTIIAEPKQLVEIDSPHGYRYSKTIISLTNDLLREFVRQLPPK